MRSSSSSKLPPAENALPAPWSSATRTSGSRSTASHTSASSRCTSWSTALRPGPSSVIRSTPSAGRSKRRWGKRRRSGRASGLPRVRGRDVRACTGHRRSPTGRSPARAPSGCATVRRVTGTVLLTGGAGYIGSHTARRAARGRVGRRRRRQPRQQQPDRASSASRELVRRRRRLLVRTRSTSSTGRARRACSPSTASTPSSTSPGSRRSASRSSEPLRYYDEQRRRHGRAAEGDGGGRRARPRVLVVVHRLRRPGAVPVNEDRLAQRPRTPTGAPSCTSRTCCATSPASDDGWRIAVAALLQPGRRPRRAAASARTRRHPEQPDAVHHAGRRRPARHVVRVFGDDYPTPDGTGVRDYIHVVDLADGPPRRARRGSARIDGCDGRQPRHRAAATRCSR